MRDVIDARQKLASYDLTTTFITIGFALDGLALAALAARNEKSLPAMKSAGFSKICRRF